MRNVARTGLRAGPPLLALLAVAVISLSACSSPSGSRSAGSSSASTRPSGASTSADTSGAATTGSSVTQPSAPTTVTTPGSASTPTSSPASTAATPPQNLNATDTVKSSLAAAFVAYKQIPADDIAGTEAGSVYYAYLPSAHTYWALARFLPGASAPLQVNVSLQDGGNFAVLTQPAAGAWTVAGIVGEPFCPSRTAIPPAVQTLWGLSDGPACTPG